MKSKKGIVFLMCTTPVSSSHQSQSRKLSNHSSRGRGALSLRIALQGICVIISCLPLFRASAEDAFGGVFSEVYPSLEEGLELVDEQKTRPERDWWFVGRSQNDVQEDINDLLDQALRALELPEVRNYRQEIRELEKSILKSRERVAAYRRARVSAREESTLGLNQLPLLTSKKGFEEKIEAELDHMASLNRELEATQEEFLQAVRSLGVDLSSEQFETLLSTVNGEDFLDLSLVFETIKGLTTHLRELTQESNEDIETARRYYGMYTVLLRILNHVQQRFLDETKNEHLPQIKSFKKIARKNIREAKDAIQAGGEKAVLENNIQANELTLEALELYRKYLLKQAADVEERNKALQAQILTADNTYNTVKLASEVVSLLQSGIDNFNALSKLEPPALAEFKNEDLRREFLKLTELMKSS